MSHFDMDFEKKFVKKLVKKYSNKGLVTYALHRRALSTALSVLRNIENVSFESLNLDLYLLIQDKEFKEIAFDYKRAIEIGKVQPEKFVEQIYIFYINEAKKIKIKNLIQKFFDFVSVIQGCSREKMDEEKSNVFKAYLLIVLNQSEFLRKNKFDVNSIVCGTYTNGEIIETDDPFGRYDFPIYESGDFNVANHKEFDENDIINCYKKYGYDILSIEGINRLGTQAGLYGNTIQFLAPYINEYTIDLIPQNYVETNLNKYITIVPKCKPIEFNIEDILNVRRRTLPTNGLTIEFDNSFFYKFLLKEVYKNGEIVLLYKANTMIGDICGIYKPNKKEFHSALEQCLNENILKYFDLPIKQTILWAYAAYTCDNEKIKPTLESYKTFIAEPSCNEIYFTPISGKLRIPSTGIPKRFIANKEGYDSKTKYINGYIRKLPIGQKASEKAIETARQLGYKLALDETYVVPFERTVWIKKK